MRSGVCLRCININIPQIAPRKRREGRGFCVVVVKLGHIWPARSSKLVAFVMSAVCALLARSGVAGRWKLRLHPRGSRAAAGPSLPARWLAQQA